MVTIRAATPEDAPLIVQMIHELADYEQLLHECNATVEGLSAWLWTNAPKAYCIIAEWKGAPAAFALYFYNFSTFLAKPGIYIEDLFVRSHYRRKGIARALFKHLAGKAVDEGCGRVEWWVLNWNVDALAFYQSLGARSMQEWTVQRLEGDALTTLAGKL